MRIFLTATPNRTGPMDSGARNLIQHFNSNIEVTTFFEQSSKEYRTLDQVNFSENIHLLKVSAVNNNGFSSKIFFIKADIEGIVSTLGVKADIIHTIGEPYYLLLRKIFKLKNPNARHIYASHGLSTKFRFGQHTHKWGEGWGWHVTKHLIKDADICTAVSKYDAEMFLKNYDRECRVIYEGVDSDFFIPFEHDNERLKILYVGRLAEYKNPMLVAKLAKCFPECDFIIHGRVGDLSLRDALVEMATKIPNLIIDESYLSMRAMKMLYSTSDIFVFPSVEWFGFVMVEAMACGLPVVGLDVGSTPEIVEHEKSGLLSNYWDFKNNLEYLIETEDVRRKMGRFARIRASWFTWERTAKEYEKLYEEVIS